MVVFGGLVLYGLFHFGDIGTVPYDPTSPRPHARWVEPLSLFLLLKGFSSGAVALTGVEAISNGIRRSGGPSRSWATTPVDGRAPGRCSSGSRCSPTG
jgi:hypothetical protein